MIAGILKDSPMWIKTTMASWIGTATGFSLSLSGFEAELRAWGMIIGSIVIPSLALIFHIYITLRKLDKDEK
tara:strand:+ start:393 stop:608 length:216 start_codon:yes stop_codon:yes gene_type:complete